MEIEKMSNDKKDMLKLIDDFFNSTAEMEMAIKDKMPSTQKLNEIRISNEISEREILDKLITARNQAENEFVDLLKNAKKEIILTKGIAESDPKRFIEENPDLLKVDGFAKKYSDFMALKKFDKVDDAKKVAAEISEFTHNDKMKDLLVNSYLNEIKFDNLSKLMSQTFSGSDSDFINLMANEIIKTPSKEENEILEFKNLAEKDFYELFDIAPTDSERTKEIVGMLIDDDISKSAVQKRVVENFILVKSINNNGFLYNTLVGRKGLFDNTLKMRDSLLSANDGVDKKALNSLIVNDAEVASRIIQRKLSESPPKTSFFHNKMKSVCENAQALVQGHKKFNFLMNKDISEKLLMQEIKSENSLVLTEAIVDKIVLDRLSRQNLDEVISKTINVSNSRQDVENAFSSFFCSEKAKFLDEYKDEKIAAMGNLITSNKLDDHLAKMNFVNGLKLDASLKTGLNFTDNEVFASMLKAKNEMAIEISEISNQLKNSQLPIADIVSSYKNDTPSADITSKIKPKI